MSASTDGNYLPYVREQYEQLPYPPRDPAQEARRLKLVPTDHLASINARCYGGRRDLTASLRVLVAGGGTGDSTVYLAEQLRGSTAQIVHLDLSTASMDVARQRLRVRDLDNVTFLQGSLLDVRPEQLGRFDYINCSGVLHHLEDPDAGLKALLSVLADDGCMGLMVYGQYGRTAHYQVQELMRLINTSQSTRPGKLANLRRTLHSLHPHHWLRFAERVTPTNDASGALDDSGLYDIFLHEQDRAYTIQEVYEWMGANRLHIPGPPGNPATRHQYDPRSYVQDPALLAVIDTLPQAQRYAVGELLFGQINRHIFYATRQPDTAASFTDLDLCPTWLDDEGEGVAAKLETQDQEKLVLKHGDLTLTTAYAEVKLRVLQAIDGKLTLGQLYAQEKLEGPTLDSVVTMLEQLYSIDALTLRDAQVPVPPSSRSLQLRVSAKQGVE